LPGTPKAFQLEPDRPRLYVNAFPPNVVAVIDTDQEKVVAQYALAGTTGNYALALDPANHRVFVGCRKEPRLLALNSETGNQIAAVDIPGDIDDLYYDA